MAQDITSTISEGVSTVKSGFLLQVVLMGLLGLCSYFLRDTALKLKQLEVEVIGVRLQVASLRISTCEDIKQMCRYEILEYHKTLPAVIRDQH